MTSADKTFYETYFNVPLILVNGAALPRRNILNLVTDADGPTDDPLNERTNIPINGILAPGGPVGSMQWHAIDGDTPLLGGTEAISVVDEDGNVEHSGKPTHKEDWADFKDGSEDSFARSQWKVGHTTDAMPTAIASISVPAADFGDCFIVVHSETSYAFTASGTKGGNVPAKAAFERSSGTLSRVGIEDLSSSLLAVGTAPGGLDIVTAGNDTIHVVATGIAATDITWISSLHIQVVIP